MDKKLEFYSIIPNKLKSDLNITVSRDNRNIIQKRDRPFFSHVNISPTFSALIPIRTNLPHSYGFITKNTRTGKSGLDYTKAYIVETKKLDEYLDEEKLIDRAEYDKISNNYEEMKTGFKEFLIDFNDKLLGYDDLVFSEKRVVDYSALQYQKDNLSLCIEELKTLNKQVNKSTVKDSLDKKGSVDSKEISKFSINSLKEKQDQISKEKAPDKTITQDKKKTIS